MIENVLLAVLVCFAPLNMGMLQLVPVYEEITAGAPDHCSSCTGVADADIFCEDFEGSGYLCSGWSPTEGSGGSIDEDASHTNSWPCTDIGSHAVAMTYVNTTTDLRKTWTDVTPIYIQFYWDITSLDADFDDGDIFVLAELKGDAAALIQLLYYHTGGTDYIRPRSKNAGGGWNNGTDVAITEDTPFQLRMYWSQGDTAQVWFDGVEKLNHTGRYNYDTDEIVFGGATTDADETMTFEIDNLKVDDDTMPSACAS